VSLWISVLNKVEVQLGGSNTVEVNVKIDVNDVIAADDHLMRNLPALRRRVQLSRFIIPFPLAMFGIVMSTTRELYLEGCFLTGFAVILLFFAPALMKWGRHRQIRSMFRSGSNRGVFGEQKIVINKTEIARYNQYGHSAYYWPAVERIEVGGKHVFIFVSAVQAIVVPKRDFSSEHEFDLFVENARMYHREAG